MAPLLILLIGIATSLPSIAGAAGEPGSEHIAVAPIDSDGVQRLTMVLDSYSYDPNHVVVQAGRPVELILNSVTTITPHNFVLKDGASGLSIDRDVGAGKQVVLQFTPMQKGTFSFYCDKKLLFFASHREKGMEGKLEVR
ncbi:cupredoxin domain-containing protein [Nitrospira sp. Nam80]